MKGKHMVKITKKQSVFGLSLALFAFLLLSLFFFGMSARENVGKEAEAAYEVRLAASVEELETTNGGFTQSQFGEVKNMSTSAYPDPTVSPTASHPYMYITYDQMDELLLVMDDPMYEVLVRLLWAEANTECDGKFPTVDITKLNKYDGKTYTNYNGSGTTTYAYDEDIISIIQNKAFASLIRWYESEQIKAGRMTGDYAAVRAEAEKYALEAVIGLKNMILTLNYSTYLAGDIYHGASHLMTATAKIYDWCYWYMDANDKNQIIGGVSNKLASKMESGMRFPPSGMSAVSGHGTGPQFLRDWVSVSLAFYSEVPSWWDFVGGRYFAEYVPAFNASIVGGWVSQGTAVYGPSKFYDAIVSARLLELSAGYFPYNRADVLATAYYNISNIQPNGYYFQTGDGGRLTAGSSLYVSPFMDIAVSYGDSTLTALILDQSNYLLSSVYLGKGWGDDFTWAKRLAYAAYLPEADDSNYLKKLDTVQYFDGNAGTMTARSSWNEDAAAVFMKIGTKTMANHDHLDHGTFQIYYKGLLAGTSGEYEKYGTTHHIYYHQATVSKNGLLVFDSKYSGSDASDLKSYYYSGGQVARSEAGTLDAWQNSGNYDMGTVLAHAEKNGEYGYIAGDITKAYDSSTVSYLERRMLTVFTGNPDYPMLFFTFDTMNATAAGTAKTFLLHTMYEPTIGADGLSADIRADGGRLYMQALYGDDGMLVRKLGGSTGKYIINGRNCTDEYVTNDMGNMWGRVEIRMANAEKDTQLLTAMVVTDADNNEALSFGKTETAELYTASFDGIVAGFTKAVSQTEQFTFTSEGTGIQKYYLTGVAGGLWKISVDGVVAAYINVTEESGVLSFTAPAGEVTVKPLATGSFNDSFENTSADIKEVSTTLGEDIHLNYYVEAPADVDIDTLTMSFTTEDGRVKSDVKGTLADNGNYVFTFSGIGPHQLAMKVRAELFAGDVSRGYKEYSVEQYCRDAIKLYPDNEKLVALINDLIIYGKAAEIYASDIDGAFVYDTGPWSVQSSEFIANQSDDKLSIRGTMSDELYVYSAGVVFGTQNRVYFKIYSSSPEAHKITIGSKTYELKNLTKGEDGYYTVSSAAVSATSLGTEILMTLDDGTNKTDVIYSINTYLYNISTKGTATANMKNLAAALYRYGNSCRVYAGIPAGGQFEGKDDFFN